MAFHAPMIAIEGEDSVWVGTQGGVDGQAVDGFAGFLAGLFVDRSAFNGEGLADEGKVQVLVEAGGNLDGAGFETAVVEGQRLTELGFTAIAKEESEILRE